jgi:hypothetical protein
VRAQHRIYRCVIPGKGITHSTRNTLGQRGNSHGSLGGVAARFRGPRQQCRFILYALVAGLHPILVLYATLLPLNIIRLMSATESRDG